LQSDARAGAWRICPPAETGRRIDATLERSGRPPSAFLQIRNLIPICKTCESGSSGGDCCYSNSNASQGTLYEGAIVSGYPSDATEDAIQASIISAGYGR
jgi:hypothetical protein